jgi:hypothetical protein
MRSKLFLIGRGSSHQFGWAGRASGLCNEILKAPVVTNQFLNTTLSTDHKLCRWRSGRPNASRPGDGTFVAKQNARQAKPTLPVQLRYQLWH